MALQPDIMYVSYYTAGSAAYNIERKPEKPKAAPVHKKRRVKRKVIAVDPIALGGILVAVCMFFMLVSGFREYQASIEQAQRMSVYVEQLQKENAALRNTYDNSYDVSDVYEKATAIGMVPKEEVEHIRIQVEIPQQEEVQLSFWENVSLFLTGLFA